MGALRRFTRAIEPWYDWGFWGGISLKNERSGDGWHLTVEWLGFQFHFAFTRFPKEG